MTLFPISALSTDDRFLAGGRSEWLDDWLMTNHGSRIAGICLRSGLSCSRSGEEIIGFRLARFTSLAFAVLGVGACLPFPIRAQTTSFDGTAALSSQLTDRGQAITGTTPILQGAAFWTFPAGWSLGLSASTEVRSPGRVVEALLQGSRYWSLAGDWQMQASLLYYRYPGSSRSRAYDRAETGLNWSYRDVLTLGLSAIYIVGAKNQRPRGTADIGFHWPLAQQFSLSAGAGVAQSLIAPYTPRYYGHTGSYRRAGAGLHAYGHLGLLWSHGLWRVELDRIVADSAARQQWERLGASPWVATISRSF